MRTNINVKAVVTIVILILVVWLGYIVFIIPRDISQGVGVCMFVFGVLNLLLYRRHARQFFEWSQSKPKKPWRFWSALGKSGIQLLFFVIGFVLIVAGIISWIKGV